VGQNSTQNPQALQRSTTIETRPLAANGTPATGIHHSFPCLELSVGLFQEGVTLITIGCEVLHTEIRTKKAAPYGQAAGSESETLER
jgi:hypothetical protein